MIDPRFRKRLQNLDALDFNYDPKTYQESKDRLGWNVDRYRVVIGQEPQGPVIPDGPFNRVKKAINNYNFPDPDLITAIFDPKADILGRDMLLRGRFLGFTFYFGVRVTAIYDETRVNPKGQSETVWGYAYRTLQGHFEIGEIRFEVCKNLTTGQIEFEIDAYSKPDRIPNPFYRAGFKLFGRPLQKYFAKSSIERVRKFASGELATIEQIA